MEMKRTLALGFLLAFIGVGTTQTAPAATGTEDGYLAAIKAWEATENRTVSPKAREVIAFAFAQYGPEFDAVGGDTVWNGSGRTRKQTFVICYLNRLRDQGKSVEAGLAADERAGRRGFPAQQRDMQLGDGGAYDIERYDVARYTIESFMRDIRPVLARHIGELVVISGQTSSVVTLDDYDLGRANTISVEPAGEHHIVVGNKSNPRHCEAEVTIVDGSSVVFQCP
jgi:hypothetical protein